MMFVRYLGLWIDSHKGIRLQSAMVMPLRSYSGRLFGSSAVPTLLCHQDQQLHSHSEIGFQRSVQPDAGQSGMTSAFGHKLNAAIDTFLRLHDC
ncbi:hypothetical protein HH214_08755 [Mucilaginibacter robiniae]|uniref:Uncharacterized protein n=1 Tax=Mucilaginibacter robiniae TaxID=2728022 RepID=A0A7L5E0E1_9SPHI|nr:hypothetical protein [Mucilaginibacter robiniae]QJD95958.1 hypothetical protein HH214_08755 [Mucilaginibacter robiniae]